MRDPTATKEFCLNRAIVRNRLASSSRLIRPKTETRTCGCNATTHSLWRPLWNRQILVVLHPPRSLPDTWKPLDSSNAQPGCRGRVRVRDDRRLWLQFAPMRVARFQFYVPMQASLFSRRTAAVLSTPPPTRCPVRDHSRIRNHIRLDPAAAQRALPDSFP